MSWIVQDAAPAATPAKRSNAKRKKGSSIADTTEPHVEDTTATTTETDSKEEKKELSKSQRKRARHQGTASTNMTEDEKNWAQISMMNVPDMPVVPEITPIAAGKKKAANTTTKKQATANTKNKKGGKKNDKGEIVVADYGKMDDWGWTPVQTEGMLMDDMDGFLCLEELDDVEVAYEGTEATGRTVIFKVNKGNWKQIGLTFSTHCS
jgi:ATP-dependent RNA helicase DDX24/MAK5